MPPFRRPASSEGARPKSAPVPVEASGGVTASWGAHGLVIRDERPNPVWAIITGHASGTNRYSWTQLNDGDVENTFTANLSDDFAAAGTSDEAGAPAYEINGSRTVATGSKVRLYPAGDGSFWVFSASGATKPGDPVGDSVPTLTADGDLQTTPLQVLQYTVNGDPASSLTHYTVVNFDATTPALQFVVENDSDGIGTPKQYVIFWPEGTGGVSPTQFQVTPDSFTQVYQLTTDPIYHSVTSPSAGVYQFVVGNEAGTQGSIEQYTVDVDGDVDSMLRQWVLDTGDSVEETLSPDQFVVDYAVGGVTGNETWADDGGDAVYSITADVLDLTAVGEVDFTGVTVTGLSGGSGGGGAGTEGTVGAAGSTQGTATLLAYGTNRVTGADSSKGVILDDATAQLQFVWNDAIIPNQLKVYPPSGAQFASGVTNQATDMDAGTMYMFKRFNSTMWTFVALVGVP